MSTKIKLSSRTEEMIRSYKKTRDAYRLQIMYYLQRLGLDVKNWEEAELCAKVLTGREGPRYGEGD